jgi:hypothetical protein
MTLAQVTFPAMIQGEIDRWGETPSDHFLLVLANGAARCSRTVRSR